MADDASDGEVEDDADWRARVRRLRPFLLDADLVPPPPNPPDASSSCFASWTRLHAKAPEPPGGFASDAGAKALDALLRDRRQAAPGAFARQCAALGGLDARRSHVLFEGELDIPTEDYYDAARALQNARWSRQRAGRAEDDLTHGRWADAVRRFGDAIALDARASPPSVRVAVRRVEGDGVSKPPHGVGPAAVFEDVLRAPRALPRPARVLQRARGVVVVLRLDVQFALKKNVRPPRVEPAQRRALAREGARRRLAPVS